MAKYSGTTVETAIEAGLSALNITREQADVTIIQVARKGFLGLGRREAVVDVVSVDQKELDLASQSSDQVSEFELKSNVQMPQPAEPQTVIENNDDKEEPRLTATEVEAELTQYLTDVIEAMGFAPKIKVEVKNRHRLYYDIAVQDESRLIGHHGRTLNALQNLGQIYINRSGANSVEVVLDVANYRAKRREVLRNLAQRTARNVIASGKPVYLNPMPAFERKQIHASLEDNDHILTYSTGKEPHRSLVIAPR